MQMHKHTYGQNVYIHTEKGMKMENLTNKWEEDKVKRQHVEWDIYEQGHSRKYSLPYFPFQIRISGQP